MRKPINLPLIGITLAVIGIAFVAFHFIFLDLIVDLWWFESLKLTSYFWLRLLYKFFIFAGVTLFFFSIFFLHFWIASRYLGLNPPDDTPENTAKRLRFQRVADVFMTWSARVYIPVSLLLAFIVALPFYQEWELSLLFFFGRSAGVVEGIFNHDVSFYMLSLPIYLLVQQELLITAILIFAFVGLLYWLEHIVVPGQSKEFHKGAKTHLIVLLSFVVIFTVWGFMLDRFTLLHNNTHEPVFYGPGLVEIRYKLPIIWLEIVSFLVFAASSMVFIFSPQHRAKKVVIISFVVFLAIGGLFKVKFIPEMIQKFLVQPSPVKLEGPFMTANINATLDAYDLKRIHTVELDIRQDARPDIDAWATQKRFENIPIWDREFLIHVYQELQEIRPYYQFNSVDEDRYSLLDHTRQVNLAAREINISRLPKAAQNWENMHLRYNHGTGAVMSPAAQDAGKPLVWYLRDLKLNSDLGVSVKEPEIYFGEEKYNYAIAPNNLKITGIDAAGADDEGLDKPYTGKSGIPISSLLRKALFAAYLREENILFSMNIGRDAQLLIRRNITERAQHITPFLRMDKDPYLVQTNDRFYWMMDAYTLSNLYPISKPAADDYLDGDDKFNYIRNSVKIVVDAFDGSISYYLADPSDAIIQAYNRAYPGLFKPLETMPAELRTHLRYPRDLFYMQMKVYAKYHQRNPELFFEQGETWQFAKVRGEPVMPYYQTMDFGNCGDKEEFVMINPMTPINRSNLSMIGVASIVDSENCKSDYTPNITVYRFGRDVQVNGPAQVEALVNQNPEISERLTLWGQGGSRVDMGRMVILPMGNTILYVLPVYITSTNTKIPELTRMIVSMGNRVVWDTSLWVAFEKLKQLYALDTADRGGTGTRGKENQ